MPIINGTRFQKKEKIKAEINSEIFAKINEYCAWANIDDIGFFIEEAASFVFAKDKDWKQYQKSSRKRTEQAHS
ncbi:hypothetical protein [Legionella nagasakiensis]|uniref:hypothetical protein n=1 Tax=Legionella nagasakiensis TaxID=535290 RepID=UPI001054EFA7|nr:hypothetical protein [Legionella nagasakiensis]